MALNEAIQHCKDVAASKCDECGKEHAQLAEWLQELVDLRIKIKRLGTELRAKHLKAIHTANELAAYKDKTPISDEFLIRNGFEKRIITNGKPTLPSPTYIYCDEVEEITVKCIDAKMDVWYVSIGGLDFIDSCEFLSICTVGQLRMFLAIEGLNELAKQLK